MRRPRPVLAATAVLLASAVFVILSAAAVPLLPGLVDEPVPAATAALGVAGLVASVGVYRIAAWGRRLGVAVGALLLVRDVAFVASGQAFETLSVALDVLLLVLLLRGWPRS